MGFGFEKDIVLFCNDDWGDGDGGDVYGWVFGVFVCVGEGWIVVWVGDDFVCDCVDGKYGGVFGDEVFW